MSLDKYLPKPEPKIEYYDCTCRSCGAGWMLNTRDDGRPHKGFICDMCKQERRGRGI